MNGDIQKWILIEQRIINEGKSTLVAYILWLFFACIGGHRFYLNKTVSAVFMLLLTVTGWLAAIIPAGFFALAIVSLWAVVDAFLIPGMIRTEREMLRQRLISEISFFSDSSVSARAC